jgi:CRP-like cAMP-binding protein
MNAPAPESADYAAIAGMLEGVELLAGIDSASLRVLARHLLARSAAQGEVIFREGEPGDWMGFLVSGEIRVHKSGDAEREVTVAVENHSRSIGEMALIDGEPRSATCVAAQPCRLLVLTRVHFHKLALERPALALEILLRLARLVSRRLRMTSGRLTDFLE